jgi:hypothetical protein
MASLRWFATVSLVAVGLGAVVVLIVRHQMGSGFRPA